MVQAAVLIAQSIGFECCGISLAIVPRQALLCVGEIMDLAANLRPFASGQFQSVFVC
jgi:hypothetical protein